MGMFDAFLGSSGTPAPTESPDLKQFLGPIMEAMAAEAKRASDPISRIGDVGSAVLGTVGSGVPYAQGLAALNKQRSDTIQGGAQLFLSMLGQERQLKALENEAAYRTEDLKIKREGLDRSQYEVKPIGQTAYGTIIYGRENKKTGEVTPLSVMPGQPGLPGQPGATGTDASRPNTGAAPPPANEAGNKFDMAGKPEMWVRNAEQSFANPNQFTDFSGRLSRDAEFQKLKTAEPGTPEHERAQAIFAKHYRDVLGSPATGDAPPNAGRDQVLGWMKQHSDPAIRSMAPTVEAIIDYKKRLPGRTTKLGQYITDLVYNADPSYSEAEYDKRSKVMKDYAASGPIGKQINAAQTAINHMDTLLQLSEALNNKDVQLVNRLKNTINTQLGLPAATNFDAAKSALANELMTYFRNSGVPSQRESEEWRKSLMAAQSPAQIKGVIATMTDLLEGRMKVLSANYERDMGGRKIDTMGAAADAMKRVREATSPGDPITPDLMSDPSKRVVGKKYYLPGKGSYRWDGDGWTRLP